MKPRIIIGNLDCEADLAALHRQTRRRSPLPQRVLATISNAATLLHVFAEDDDLLWTPVPVDPASMPDVPGLPTPRLVSGPLNELPTGQILAWAETPAVAALRRRQPPEHKPTPPPDLPFHQVLWHLPVPLPEVVARVHHRSFSLRMAQELGCALPGARMVASLANLEAHLKAGGADAGHEGHWVVKAPFSAAGRDRFLVPGEPGNHRQLERLFARHGELLFEPWMQRVEDFGAGGWVSDDEARVLGAHRLQVDEAGRFQGIDVPAGGEPWGWLPAAWARSLREAAEHVGRTLRREGYRGPFGIDAFAYRKEDSEVVFQPVVEVNARLTVGLVARALLAALHPSVCLRASQSLQVRFGTMPSKVEREHREPGYCRSWKIRG